MQIETRALVPDKENMPPCARLSARSEYGACATCWKSVQSKSRVSLLAAAMNFEWYEHLELLFHDDLNRDATVSACAGIPLFCCLVSGDGNAWQARAGVTSL